jgi:hypothetical protein
VREAAAGAIGPICRALVEAYVFLSLCGCWYLGIPVLLLLFFVWFSCSHAACPSELMMFVITVVRTRPHPMQAFLPSTSSSRKYLPLPPHLATRSGIRNDSMSRSLSQFGSPVCVAPLPCWAVIILRRL